MIQNTYSERIMVAQQVDETTSTVLGPGKISDKKHHTFYVEFGTGVTAGVVQIETASHPDQTGTWAPLPAGGGTITFAGTAPNAQIVSVEAALLAVRARISTAIANGTVTVTYVGN